MEHRVNILNSGFGSGVCFTISLLNSHGDKGNIDLGTERTKEDSRITTVSTFPFFHPP